MNAKESTAKWTIALTWILVTALGWYPVSRMMETLVSPCLRFLGQSGIEQVRQVQALLGAA